MATVKRYVEVVMQAKDQGASAGVQGLAGKIGNLTGAHLALAAAALKAGQMTVRAIKESIKAATEYQHAMAEVRTLTNASAGDHAKLTKQVRDLTVRYGQLDVVMSKASYNVVSAGFADMNQQMKLLDVSARAAIAGVTDVNTAAGLLTQTLNAYGESADEAERYADVMFATVKAGVTTFPELAAHLGKVTATASTANISFEEVAAAMAVMTKKGINTAEAATALNSLLVALAAGSGEAKAKLDELGITLDNGLAPALAAVDAAGGESLEILKTLIPNIRALKAASSAGANGAAELKEQIKANAESAGSMNTAFDIMQGTMKSANDRLDAAKRKLETTFGEKFLGPKIGMVKLLTAAVDGLADSLDTVKAMSPEEQKKLAGGSTGEQQRSSSSIESETLGQIGKMKFGGLGAGALPNASVDMAKYDPVEAARQEAEKAAALLESATAAIKQRTAPARSAGMTGADWWNNQDSDPATQMFGDPEVSRQTAQETEDLFNEMHQRLQEQGRETQEVWMDGVAAYRDEWASVKQSMVQGGAQMFGQAVTHMVGLRDGAFMAGRMIKTMLVSALEQVIQKLIMIKLLKVGLGGPLGFFAQGGRVPGGYAAGGRIPRAAAGYSVPDGARGMDSQMIMAMPGEEVISRVLSQRLDRWLSVQEGAAAASPLPLSGGGGGGGGVTIALNVARPVNYHDALDLGEAAVDAAEEFNRGYL